MEFRPYDTRPLNKIGNSGLWIPSGEGDQDDSWNGVQKDTVKEINALGERPVVERHTEAHWTLKFPADMGGLFARSSAVKRPTANGMDRRLTYGLMVMRYDASIGGMVDPGFMTLEEITALRDFLSEVIRESRG